MYRDLRVLIAGPRIFGSSLVYSEENNQHIPISYRHLLFPMFDASLLEIYEMFTGSPEVVDKRSITIISGQAKGIDTEGINFAEARGYSLEVYPAEWQKYKKSAGFIRNEVMVKRCHAGIIVWDEESRGTKHTIDLLDERYKPYILWKMNKEDYKKVWDERMISYETLNAKNLT